MYVMLPAASGILMMLAVAIVIPLMYVMLPAVSGILMMPAVGIRSMLVILPAVSGTLTKLFPSGDLSLAILAVATSLIFVMLPVAIAIPLMYVLLPAVRGI
jgi:hypothetical protein